MTDLLGVAAVAPVGAAVRVAGLGLLSGVVAGVVAFLYRWYARERVPTGLAALVGTGAVGVWLNTATALQQFLGGATGLPATGTALVTVSAFVVAAVTASAGAAAGDRLLTDVAALSGSAGLNDDVRRVVSAVGRVVAVELPETVEDIDGYDSVADETKDALAGTTLLFPRGLSRDELRERLVARLRDDYGVGHVDADLGDGGRVAYLGVGGRLAGIGPTLGPESVAVAVRADPPSGASSGDAVQVWRPGDPPERVAVAELRGTAEDVVTLAVDAEDAAALDPATTYRLVTLPGERRPEREFAAQLRSADETMAAVTVAADSDLVGLPVGSLDATVVAVRAAASGVEAIPGDDRRLAAGDVVYVIGRPERLRQVATAADGAATDGQMTP